MKLMITGGSGLIGSALADAYRDQGHQVVIVSRKPGISNSLIKSVPWEKQQLASELGNTDAVIHLAAEVQLQAVQVARQKRDTDTLGDGLALGTQFTVLVIVI